MDGHTQAFSYESAVKQLADISFQDGKTPKDIAAEECPHYWPDEYKDRVTKGRQEILQLMDTVQSASSRQRKVGPGGGELQIASCTISVPPGAVTMETEMISETISPPDVTPPASDEKKLPGSASTYSSSRKVGPEGGELQTASCTVSVPPAAVTIETEIICDVISPNDVTLPLKDGEMLVSDVIELGPHGTTFHKPVNVQLQYCSEPSGGAREPVMWVTEDGSLWTELLTSDNFKGKLTVSVDHFSIFAVISRLKQDQFSVPAEGCTLTSSTQPAVQISFPEQSVEAEEKVNLQVEDVPKRAVEDIKEKDQSSRGLLGTSPIVSIEFEENSSAQLKKPVTVRVPHPLRYMDVQHHRPYKLRVMSCEQGTEDWVDVTDDVNIRETEAMVKFDVTHFTRFIVLVIVDIFDDPKKFGKIPLKLNRWIQNRSVQFILLQREDDPIEFVVECAPAEEAAEKRAKLIKQGYKGPVPTGEVNLFEGQAVEICLIGNVSIAAFDSCSSTKPQIIFHSLKTNRLHLQIEGKRASGQSSLDGKGKAKFAALPRVEVEKKDMKGVKIRRLSASVQTVKKRHITSLCELPIHVPPCKTMSEGADSEPVLEGVEKYFYFTKEKVSTHWIDLAMKLGFKWADIQNFAGQGPDAKTHCLMMLGEWKQRKGDAATVEVLLKALEEAELQDVVDGLKDRLAADDK